MQRRSGTDWLPMIGRVLSIFLAFPIFCHARDSVVEVLQTSPVAGFQHYAGGAMFSLMQLDDELSLSREPDNPYDQRAVRVFWRGVQIGHAPRLDNVDLARFLDQGARIEGRIVHLQKSRDPWKRVLMDIVLLREEQSESALNKP